MGEFNDYIDGTAFLVLCDSDFKSVERFAQYAHFIGQDGFNKIVIPIDSERARRLRFPTNCGAEMRGIK